MKVAQIKSTKYYGKEYERCLEHYKLNEKNTQVLRKYFTAFIKNNVRMCFSRCRRLALLPKRGVTLYRCLLIYGKREGLQFWNNYRDKQAFSNTQEYKGMTDEEFKEYNNNRATTLVNFIKRHGDLAGTEKWNSYTERQAFTNTLEYFVEKYGDIKGTDEWIKVNKLKGHSLDTYLLKCGDEGFDRYISYNNTSRSSSSFASKISQDLFDEITRLIDLPETINIYYSRRNKEYGVLNKTLSKYTFFDFVIPELKLCIEFNGDVFHANPDMYTSEDTPNPFVKDLTSEEIWKYDSIKNNEIINRGYNIIIVWERDYVNARTAITQTLVKEILRVYDKYAGNK